MRNVLPLLFFVPAVALATGGTMAGSGTAADPWQVADYDDLKNVGFDPYTMDGHYRLVADIDAKKSRTEVVSYSDSAQVRGFKPIGQLFPNTASAEESHGRDKTVPFSGSFNGAGHTISNLFIVNYIDNPMGFFVVLDSSARVDSLTFKDYHLKGAYAGGIVGKNYGTINEVHVQADTLLFSTSSGGIASENYGTIVSSSFTGMMSGAYLGGIAYENFGTISKCEMTLKNGTEGIELTMFGGIAHKNRGAIEDCKTSGGVRASVNIGGIASENYGTVERCTSSVDIVGAGGTTFQGLQVKNVAAIGGLVAIDSGKIMHSHSSGHITATANNVGGFVGVTFGEIVGCSASGAVKVVAFGGAFVGTNRGKIDSCYATGKITGSSYLGGFAGYNFGEIKASHAVGSVDFTGASAGGFVARNEPGGKIDNCYATGNVNGYNYAGGFAAENNGEISYSHANGHVKGTTSVGGFVGKQEGGKVIASYATGAVYGEIYVGGFAGGLWKNSSVEMCYSTGDIVEGEILVGGFTAVLSGSTVVNSFSLGNIYSTSDNFHEAGSFVGVADSASGVETSYSMGGITNKVEGINKLCAMENVTNVDSYYWNSDKCSPVDTANYGIALTGDQMKSKENFSGFDFDQQWEYREGALFPTLVAVPFDSTRKDTAGVFSRGPERYVPGDVIKRDTTIKIIDTLITTRPVDPVIGLDAVPEVTRLAVPFTCHYAQGAVQMDFTLPRSGVADVRIFDFQGREVGAVPALDASAGMRGVRWDASQISRGRYVAVLRLDGKAIAKSTFQK